MPTIEPDHLARIRAFCDRAEELDVQGLDFQHAAICRRRCWLHLHRASMNEWSDLIRLGEVLQRTRQCLVVADGSGVVHDHAPQQRLGRRTRALHIHRLDVEEGVADGQAQQSVADRSFLAASRCIGIGNVDVLVRKDEGAMNGVAQLTHISGPGVSTHYIERTT